MSVDKTDETANQPLQSVQHQRTAVSLLLRQI